jgi:hypothetical protein
VLPFDGLVLASGGVAHHRWPSDSSSVDDDSVRAQAGATISSNGRPPPQIAMANQLGLHCVIADTFKTLWWVPHSASPSTIRAYLNALDRAEKAMDADPDKYLPLWRLTIPAEFESYHPWDFSKFGRGERFIYQSLSHEEFNEVVAMVERWGLDDFMKERSMEKLVYAGAPI